MYTIVLLNGNIIHIMEHHLYKNAAMEAKQKMQDQLGKNTQYEIKILNRRMKEVDGPA